MFLSTNSHSIVYTFSLEYISIPSHIVVCPLFNITNVHKPEHNNWLPFIKKGCFFHVISFFLKIDIDSLVTLHLVHCLVGKHSTAASIWTETKFSYSSFGVCLSDVSWKVSNLFLTVNVYWLLISLLVSEDQPRRKTLLVCFLFLCKFRWFGIYSLKK